MKKNHQNQAKNLIKKKNHQNQAKNQQNPKKVEELNRSPQSSEPFKSPEFKRN